jgi:putative membrane protein
MLYLSLKAAHVIFVVAWMASLLIYPRYKIHQLTAQPGDVLHVAMKAAALRLRRTIMVPSMILVWLLGVGMIALQPGLLDQGWLQVKILLVIGMTGMSEYFLILGRKIDAQSSGMSDRTLRVLNEVPFLLLIVFVVLVVLKPF